MLDQNQTIELIALLQALQPPQRTGRGTATNQAPAGLPGLRGGGGGGDFSSGGLGGLGSVGGYGTNGPSVSSAPAGPGLGATNGWSATTGAYGNPANAWAQAVLAAVGIAPGIAGAIGKLGYMGLGLANQFGLAGQQPQGPAWLERLSPLRALPVVGPYARAAIAAGRAIAPATLSEIIDRKIELDVSLMNSPSSPGYSQTDFDSLAALGSPGVTQSLDLEVSLMDPTSFSFTDLDNFAADYSGMSFSDPTDFDFSADFAGVAGDSGSVGDDIGGDMGDFGGSNDDLSDGGMGGEGMGDDDAGGSDSGGESEGDGGDSDGGDGGDGGDE